jgi:hypothetical protein
MELEKMQIAIGLRRDKKYVSGNTGTYIVDNNGVFLTS